LQQYRTYVCPNVKVITEQIALTRQKITHKIHAQYMSCTR